ncbi:MAG: type II toxin-antitoxin system VapC family toxin [Azoarcus sp.]|jgi:predicted nucleic acid-binding protein|nr:type II toxin-antitoxin system VapC family toxin [Azoarcus sp.]
MILLDTNVVSEPLRVTPDARIPGWIDAQPIETLYLSAITVAELRVGIARMPAGKKRDRLRERIETQVLPRFFGRVLAFDLAATQSYAGPMTKARAGGVAIGNYDGCIAAIALANGLTVATRDTTPFKAAGVPVFNPWQS